MKRCILLLFSVIVSCLCAFADYSSHGRPWDADDNYDSSRGLWFVAFVIIVLIVIGICAFAKHIWDNNKSQVKEGFGIIAFFGGCILLFLAGKTCSEHNHKDNGHVQPLQQPSTPSPQYAPTHPSNQFTQPQRSNNVYQQPQQPRYRTEYYDERCSQCYGSGSVVCTYCGGKGYTSVTCTYCGGRGSKHVRKGGQNFLTGEWETYETDEMCSACFGKGVTEQRCSHCNSEYPYGNHLISTYMTCPTCHGQGIFHKTRQVPY